MKKIISKVHKKVNFSSNIDFDKELNNIYDDINKKYDLVNKINEYKDLLVEHCNDIEIKKQELIQKRINELEEELKNKLKGNYSLIKNEITIRHKQKVNAEIKKLNYILESEKNILDKYDIKSLEIKIKTLESLLISVPLAFEEKHKSFFYKSDEIKNAPNVKWLYSDIIPYNTIGIIYGSNGTGKSTFLLEICKRILHQNKKSYIVYIDGDMALIKLKELKINELIEEYPSRFIYGGKNDGDLVQKTQVLLKDLTNLQSIHKDREYISIEDSLNLTAAKKKGFIDKEKLYLEQRKFRAVGGTSIILHHTNKLGDFSDTKQIEDYCDYSFCIERNEFNSSILVKAKKASRFDIKSKAFRTMDRKIIEEISFEEANIAENEIKFIFVVTDLLSHEEMKQSEIITNLKDIRFFSEYKVGQKKATYWLKKWSEKGKWKYEQRPSEKNAIYYSLKTTHKKEKNLKNCKTTIGK